MPRALVVTVDTEEEGLWTSTFPASGQTCANVRRLGRIHRIFVRLGIVPTYLVDFPVVEDPWARDALGQLTQACPTEIGAHLHPWCNPPLDEPTPGSWAASYAHNLPPRLQEAKLALLCERIQDAFGARPTSYRAGRWGFDCSTIPVLEKLGFVVDSSVRPLWWDPTRHGPQFARAPLAPYYLDEGDACRAGHSGVLEVPVSSLIVGRFGALVERVVRRAGPTFGLDRLAARLGLCSLRPELHSLAEMRALTDALVARELPVFNLMFHSSAALPGASPYVADEPALDAFCRRLEATLEYLLAHDARPLALSDIPAFLGRPLAARSAA